MKKRLRIGYFIFLLLFFAGCRKDQWNDCFQGTGKDKTEARYLGSFTKLNIGEKFDIVLTQDTNQIEEIKITAGSHIIDQIITRVNDNTLTIENKNTCNFVRSYDRKIRIEIRVRFLNDIEIFSATNLTNSGTLHFEKSNYLKLKNYGLGDINLKLKLGFLDVQSINSGNIFLEGEANIFACSIEEVTVLDARKLLCDDVYITTVTPLDCFVNGRNKIIATMDNDGSVFFVSKPDLTIPGNVFESHGRGKGRLLKL